MEQVGDIICRRLINGGAEVSIPQTIVKHSPTGFEWAYAGSGPADLALNILARFIGRKKAEENGLYQDFKWDFIATLPYDGGTIRADGVWSWLAKHGIQRSEDP